jgi:hypothetical protein
MIPVDRWHVCEVPLEEYNFLMSPSIRMKKYGISCA